jgi:hypothetical protein
VTAVDLTYVPSYLTFSPRDGAGWPTFLTIDQKRWLVTEIDLLLRERGALTLNEIFDSLKCKADFALKGVCLWDAIYASLDRACRAADAMPTWKLR